MGASDQGEGEIHGESADVGVGVARIDREAVRLGQNIASAGVGWG